MGAACLSADEVPAGDHKVLLIRADYLFETRTLTALLEHSDSILFHSDTNGRAAAVTAVERIEEASRLLIDETLPIPENMSQLKPADLLAFDVALRRVEPPLLEPVSESRRAQLEDQLYGNSYKGITDLVTKWLWPRPAKKIVRVCAQSGITPNMVTTVSLLLVLLACWCFYEGHFWSGLIAGWAMTLLDTVDGKLARVTVKSSRFGHYFDHIIDLVHPPIWYLCWGEAIIDLTALPLADRSGLYWIIIAGYLGGRIIEGLFHLFANCSVFGWRPFDAWFRLITARRNPCLILLSVTLLLQRPDWGLYLVALWTLLTTLVLLLRLIQAAIARLRSGKRLESWLSEADVATHHRLSYRTFASTRGAYAAG